MLYELGSGIMQVKDIAGRGDAFYLIDGGFARVSENLLTVLAYDVTTFEEMEREAALELISRAKSVIVGGGYVRQTEKMEVERARLLVRMGEMASLDEQ
jgi:F0F1-type ATP synthase epsilon subunit